MSDQSATGDNAPEVTETTPEGPPEWLGPIQQRMEEQAEQMAQMNDAISGLYYGDDDDDDDEEPVEYDSDEDAEAAAARKFVGDEVESRVEARFAKEKAERALDERNALFAELQNEIPALQDPKYARELVTAAAQKLKDHGLDAAINTPYIVEVIEDMHNLKAGLEDRAGQEGQAPEKDVVLESGSGAAPQQQEEEDWGDRIVKAAEALRPTI
jgi:hypothetical protein